MDFLLRNSSLRLAFLLRVDGLALFLVIETGESLHLVSKVKEKVLPMLRENWNALPWLVSALQKSKHCAARGESDSLTVAILVNFLIEIILRLPEKKSMLLVKTKVLYVAIMTSRPQGSVSKPTHQ